jgi:hypothetical protein
MCRRLLSVLLLPSPLVHGESEIGACDLQERDWLELRLELREARSTISALQRSLDVV